jgi:hypothetical protein
MLTDTLGQANVLQRTFPRHFITDNGISPKAVNVILPIKKLSPFLFDAFVNTPCHKTTQAQN